MHEVASSTRQTLAQQNQQDQLMPAGSRDPQDYRDRRAHPDQTTLKERAVALRDAGHRSPAIAAQLGISERTIRHWLRRVTSARTPQHTPHAHATQVPVSHTSAHDAAAETTTTGWPPALSQAAQERAQWRETGERYQALAEKTLRREHRAGRGRTLLIAGRGAYLGIEQGALIVHQGRTHGCPGLREVLHAALHDVRLIIWTDATTGTLTLPAVAWCQREGVNVVLLSQDGALLASLAPDGDTSDAQLRRRQYLAQSSGQDVVIAQELLRRKLIAQRQALSYRADLADMASACDVLDTALAWLSMPVKATWLDSIEVLRTYEARTAHAYFASWNGWPLRWKTADAKRIPPHWLTARERSSPLAPGGNARHAVDPLNACLNYAYALLEGQCRLALNRFGFDVACGFLHADKPGRDSLVYDLMECERGTVDGVVLSFLSRTTLHAGDFTRALDGGCRLHPQLARALVAGCRVPQEHVDAHARWLRDALMERNEMRCKAVPTGEEPENTAIPTGV